MITGIGVDIIELNRIEQAISKRARFVERILSPTEIEVYYQKNTKRRKIEYVAGRFAAKEAFAKAAGTGIGTLSFTDIEVLSNSLGAPELTAVGFDQMDIFLSISHSKAYAIAQVVIAKK